MPLPTTAQQATLDYTSQGRPAVCVEAKSLTSTTLDITYNGRPAVATSAAAAPTTVFSWWAWSTYGASGDV